MDLVIALVIVYAIYLALFGYPVVLIGQSYDFDHRWMGWVPVLGLFVLTSAADMTHWYVLLFVVPLVNIIAGPYLWARICLETGQNEVKGWLTLVPVLNIIMIWSIALGTARTTPRPA